MITNCDQYMGPDGCAFPNSLGLPCLLSSILFAGWEAPPATTIPGVVIDLGLAEDGGWVFDTASMEPSIVRAQDPECQHQGR